MFSNIKYSPVDTHIVPTVCRLFFGISAIIISKPFCCHIYVHAYPNFNARRTIWRRRVASCTCDQYFWHVVTYARFSFHSPLPSRWCTSSVAIRRTKSVRRWRLRWDRPPPHRSLRFSSRALRLKGQLYKSQRDRTKSGQGGEHNATEVISRPTESKHWELKQCNTEALPQYQIILSFPREHVALHLIMQQYK